VLLMAPFPWANLLSHSPPHYTNSHADRAKLDGWVRSPVFGRAFRLTRQADPLGHPQFLLEVRG